MLKTLCAYLYALQLRVLQLKLNRALRLAADALAEYHANRGARLGSADWSLARYMERKAHDWRLRSHDLESDIDRVQRRRALGLLPAYAWWLPAIALVAGIITFLVL